MNLKVKAGFDWSKVTWGRPDSVRSALCSYCSTAIPNDSVPLIIWTGDGHVAQFCDQCMTTWWGFRGLDNSRMI